MRFCTISDLIAHSRTQLKPSPVPQLRVEITANAQENVPLFAPVVGAISGRVFDHPNTDRPEMASTPRCDSRLTGMFGWLDRVPIRRAEGQIVDLHDGLREAYSTSWYLRPASLSRKTTTTVPPRRARTPSLASRCRLSTVVSDSPTPLLGIASAPRRP